MFLGYTLVVTWTLMDPIVKETIEQLLEKIALVTSLAQNLRVQQTAQDRLEQFYCARCTKIVYSIDLAVKKRSPGALLDALQDFVDLEYSFHRSPRENPPALGALAQALEDYTQTYYLVAPEIISLLEGPTAEPASVFHEFKRGLKP